MRMSGESAIDRKGVGVGPNRGVGAGCGRCFTFSNSIFLHPNLKELPKELKLNDKIQFKIKSIHNIGIHVGQFMSIWIFIICSRTFHDV